MQLVFTLCAHAPQGVKQSVLSVVYLKVTISAGTNVLQIGPKTQNFVPANISYMDYRTSEYYVDHVPSPQIAQFSTCKTCFNQKRGKMYL